MTNYLKFNPLFLLILAIYLSVLHGAIALAAEGKILVPKSGDTVDAVYEAKGIVKDLPVGNALWIAVRKGNNYWPKEKALVIGGKKWTASINESATRLGGPYSLVLLSVGPKGQIEISDWYRIAEERNIFPAMVDGVKWAMVLDMVEVRRK